MSLITFRAGAEHLEGVDLYPTRGSSQPLVTMGTSSRTGLVTQPTQPEFFYQSQLVLYRLLLISFRLFFTGHWHPETLEPRVEAPGHRNLGTLEPRVSVCLSRSTPRLISTFSQIRDVELRPHGCERNTSHTQGSGCEINASHTHQSSPSCHGQAAGITFQLSP